eukprot:jgi/Bigna1/140252/aug1.55_g14960
MFRIKRYTRRFNIRGFLRARRALGVLGPAVLCASLYTSHSHSFRQIAEAKAGKRPLTTAQPAKCGPAKIEGTSLVVFGGSSGIGKAVAIGTAQQGAARIHIVARNPEKLAKAKAAIEAAGNSVKVFATSSDAFDEKAVRRGSAKCGDLIKNNRTCDDVRRQMNFKFYAQLAPVLAIGTKIKEGGSIVMTSGVSSRRPGKGNDALAIANAAIETAVKTMACDQGFDGRKCKSELIA